ncbi:MAG: hypothetical protein JSS66_06585 [Armatimonadetes bacterium]|nr:hypothetical protein [Armatimonadota bacterium]
MSTTCQCVDANGVVNFFDADRVKTLASQLSSAMEHVWPKAKKEDLIVMSEEGMWMLLDASKDTDVLTAQGRSIVCDAVSDALCDKYTIKCKPKPTKPTKKVTAKTEKKNSALFVQHTTMLAFVLFGDLKKDFELFALDGGSGSVH